MLFDSTIKFQLVDENAELIKDAKTKFDNEYLMKKGKEYFTLGIIGAQSSGKSTLQNHVFGTSFDVLDSHERRGQTTKGIWVAHQNQHNVLILDIEGSDSRERWEGKTMYERTTALFGLVMSNLLIINLWTQEIGRFSAANYEIIKVIFDLNIRLFNQESPKVILFVIRDFDHDEENFLQIKELITTDIHKLWAEIKKPATFDDSMPEKYFQVKFFPMSHYKYKRDKFEADAVELKDRFTNPQNKDYYFNHVEFEKNLPYDGLYLYVEKVWGMVRENKELNLPSQKIMVSNFRCTEVKKEVIDESNNDLENLRKSVKGGFNGDLKNNMIELMGRSTKVYKEMTFNYDDAVAEEKEKELEKEMIETFDNIALVQIKKIKDELLKAYKVQLDEIRTLRDIKSVIEGTKNLKREFANRFKSKLEQTCYNTPSEDVINNFNSMIDSENKSFITAKMNNLFKSMHNQKLKEMEQSISSVFGHLQPKFWAKYIEKFNQDFDNYGQELEKLRSDVPELQAALKPETIDIMKMELYLILRSNVSNKFSNIQRYIMERFRRLFECTPTGMKKNWKMIEEALIEQDFGKAKEAILEIWDEAKSAEFPAFNSEDSKPMIQTEDCSTVFMRIEDQMNEILEKAYNSKYNLGGLNKIPKWIWLVLLFLGRNDILNVIMNPVFMTPIIVQVGAMLYLWKSGGFDKIHSAYNVLAPTITAAMSSSQRQSTRVDEGSQ